MTDFVEAGEEIKDLVGLTDEFVKRCKYRDNDNLCCDELTKRELPIDDKPSTDCKDAGTGKGLEEVAPGCLAVVNGEVFLPGFDVLDDGQIGAFNEIVAICMELETNMTACQLFKPVSDAVLFLALNDAGSQATDTKNSDDKRHR